MDGAFPSQKGQSFDNVSTGNGGFAGRGRGGRGFRGTAENAKTKMCNRWLQGECRFGDRCNFAHGDHELRKLPDRDPAAAGPGRGYGGPPRGRGGYGYGRGGGPGGRFAGRGYGGPGYPAGYGMDQAPQGNYGGEPRGNGGMQEDVYAAQNFPTQGPNGWCMYRVKETGEGYYHNARTGVTQWEKPAEWVQGPSHM